MIYIFPRQLLNPTLYTLHSKKLALSPLMGESRLLRDFPTMYGIPYEEKESEPYESLNRKDGKMVRGGRETSYHTILRSRATKNLQHLLGRLGDPILWILACASMDN